MYEIQRSGVGIGEGGHSVRRVSRIMIIIIIHIIVI